MSLSKLKTTVSKLPSIGYGKLRRLLSREEKAEREAEEFDRQIAEDAKAGKLDHLAERARAHYRAGNTTSL